MNRLEKTIAFLLSSFLFFGLFYFIFTSLRTPVASPPLGETDFYDTDEDLFRFEELEDVPDPKNSIAPETKKTPALPAPTPKKK